MSENPSLPVPEVAPVNITASASDSLIVYVLEVADRPGVMHAIAAVFSHRGLSIYSLLADNGRKLSRVLVSFRGTDRQHLLVERVLTRLHNVTSVRALHADSPELRAIAIGRVTGELPDMPELIVQRQGEDVVVLTGRYTDVESAVSRLEAEDRVSAVACSLVAL